MSPQKIILVANTDWYLYNFRLALARFLRGQGYEVLLISPSGRYASLLQQAGFRWIEWKVGRQTLAPWAEFTALLQLARLYRQEKPTLVHQHTIKPVLYGSLAARLARIPAVVNSITGRGYIFVAQDRKARLLRRVVGPLYRLAFANPHCAVIFENDVDRQYFVSQGLLQAGRAFLIEGVGVDSERFAPTPEPAGVPVIVLPARMLWDKGVGVLVDAARLLNEGETPVQGKARVALVGVPDPGNPASIDEATLRGWEAEGVVEWWGWQEDMSTVYPRCHIVTLPTVYGEGVPTALLEAAACGKPLVATDAPGCRDVVRHEMNGLLVPPNDPPALAAALRRLVDDPNLRGRMGVASRQLVLEKFTTGQVNAATLQVYESILKNDIC
jgi:glycosyltransferase involved in cell wall biosynthesis